MTFHSQIGQDEWVNTILKDKNTGYFIELGACDGVNISNTLYFENKGWDGLCIEPNDILFKQLMSNRKCSKSNCLVSGVKGLVVDFSMCGCLSGIIDDNTGPFTRKNNSVRKTTSTLEDVLDFHKAPHIIDYLSLDVEGHEYDILKTFPFDKYSFRCITVEHNEPHVGPAMQMQIRNFLENVGFTFIKGNDDVNGWGHGPIDDFYVNEDLI